MMLQLFKSELQRLYRKKTTWLCFLAIPFIILLTAKFYLNNNLNVNKNSAEFTHFYNFPIASLQELGMFSINLIVILLIVLSTTEELTNGSLRMVFIRPVKKSKILYSKFLSIVLTIFMMLLLYMLLSYIIGFFFFDKYPYTIPFYWETEILSEKMFLYVIKYFFLSFLSLTSIACMEFFISTLSKSVTVSLSINLGVFMSLLILPSIVESLLKNTNSLLFQLQWLSIVHIQLKGIPIMLGQYHILFPYALYILVAYAFIFTILNHLIYSKSDFLI